MNKLTETKRIQIIRCLTEGMSVRGTGRVVGVSKGAILRLIAEIGPACERFHDRGVHDVPRKRLELDEMFQFVYAKRNCVPERLSDTPGGRAACTCLRITASKLIISFYVR